MTPETLQKAVELADGWTCREAPDGWWIKLPNDTRGSHIEHLEQWALDAIAAQLVRQVDALHLSGEVSGTLVIRERRTIVHGTPHIEADGPDRTENTIRAIVESGVLDDV